MEKTCNKCGCSKALDGFYPKSGKRGTEYAHTAAGYSYQCRDCDKEARSLYVVNNPDKSKDSDRGYHLSKYGLSVSDYNALFERQSGCCIGCGRHQMELKKRLCVDHDHKSGKVRGLLCIPCNLILGYARDTSSILSSLINYLNISDSAANTETKVG